MAVAALTRGICGSFMVSVAPILAIVFGTIGQRTIDRSAGTQSGRGMAKAGIILGWVGLAYPVLFIVSFAAGIENSL